MGFSTPETRRDAAIALVNQQKHLDAIPLLLALLRESPLDWELHFAAGQAFLATDEPVRAREHFDRALAIRPDSVSTMVLLGLTLGKLKEPALARDVFFRAAILNPDEDQAFLGLALVQRDIGEFEKALANLESAANAVARQLARHVRRTNDRSCRIYKHRSLGSELWVEQALFGAMFLCAEDDVDSMSYPDGEAAEMEERTERHGGLYFVDSAIVTRRFLLNRTNSSRLFLPNYFNSFREWLLAHPTSSYLAICIGKSTVLRRLGREEEARAYSMEAEAFRPR